MSIVQKLTEGILHRDLKKEGAALMNKWERTGLLEGIDDDFRRNAMSLLLENQAKELLREASTMAGGDVEGFAAVAFPLVRRVFGSLLANELVSVQPMSLPSGLIFFMDFQHNDTRGGIQGGSGAFVDSLYGGRVVGSQITGGVDLDNDRFSGDGTGHDKSFYNLNQGYSSPTKSATSVTITHVASGTAGDPTSWKDESDHGGSSTSTYSDLGDRLIQFDPDLSGSGINVGTIAKSSLPKLNNNAYVTVYVTGTTLGDLATPDTHQVRRLTVTDPNDSSKLLLVFALSGTATAVRLNGVRAKIATAHTFHYAAEDAFKNADNGLGNIVGTADWLLESDTAGSPGDVIGDIPEIDIKVDSIPVTAITKKLKAKWSPELGQDLNAYHNLDAEVELTSILSEQIALEIDREILGDLVKGATGKTLYWSRSPGKFVKRTTGADLSAGTNPPDFTGNVSEWYETLIETVNEVSAHIHRKTLRGGANFVVTSPEVANILEFTAGFRASVVVDEVKGGSAGAIKVGNVSKKWDIYVDPYFPRNLMLVGRKGSSFLESGYVYAPYVPLQVTPTIFQPEDFTPRKGVMTRYAKKMVRPDMYGLVVVTDLLG